MSVEAKFVRDGSHMEGKMLCLLLHLLGTWGPFITSYTSMQWQLAHSYNSGKRWYCGGYNLSVSKCHIIVIFQDLSSTDNRKIKGYDFTKYVLYNTLYSLRYIVRKIYSIKIHTSNKQDCFYYNTKSFFIHMDSYFRVKGVFEISLVGDSTTVIL